MTETRIPIDTPAWVKTAHMHAKFPSTGFWFKKILEHSSVLKKKKEALHAEPDPGRDL